MSDFFKYTRQTTKKAITETDASDFKNFLSHLALAKRVSASTQNQAFNAILFFFRYVLGKEVGNLADTVRAKRGQKLPIVFSVEEVKRLLVCMNGKDLLITGLLYGAGLRLMELARLRVKDIKWGYGEVHLPDALSRKYPNVGKEWAWQYVFPANNLSVDPRSGRVAHHHISDSAIQEGIKKAIRKAGIPKHASLHTLRHSFAMHLLMNGVNIREVQELLGHKNFETTMIYTHMLRDMSKAPKSPLDLLLE